MPIIRKCDFTGDIIEVIETIGIATPIGTVDIVEQISEGYTIDELHAGRQAELAIIKTDWQVKQAEEKNFYKQQLRKTEEEFYIARAKEYYGTFYSPEIEQQIKDYLS